ncbi:MAG TPA: nucleotide exchange factor GrpE [Candidatus Nanopelagicaceae bacterium]|nr:nucleotide exchange factor GrpE [Candidatus Nanopelagicaceae bacterium]
MTNEANKDVTNNEESSPTDSVGEGILEELVVPVEVDEVATLTSDLQRLQAEYSNYRKRVERDRLVSRDLAVASVLLELIPILDDIERAREHGELEGGFKAVAEQVEKVATKFGLERFGEPGVPFDPAVHEALVHSVSEDVDIITAIEILQPGYRLNDRTLRPARVVVADPA